MGSTGLWNACTGVGAMSWGEPPRRLSGLRPCWTKAFAPSESEAPMTVPSVQSDAAEAVSRFATALDQAEVRSELDGLCAAWSGSRPQEVRVQTLKCHIHHRCTFDIALKTAVGWRSLIAKVYFADRSDLFHAMEAVGRAGFGPEAEFSIPRPLAYVSSARVLLVEKIPGRSAKEIFL